MLTARLSRIALIAVALLAGCAVGNALAASGPKLECGVERHLEKVMADEQAGAVNLVPQETTIEDLDALTPTDPVKGHEARGVPGDQEFHTHTVEGSVFVAKLEADRDVHIALSDGQGHTMVVEAVDPRCAKGSIVLDDITAARVAVLHLAGDRAITQATLQRLVGKHVRVVGVAFFDRCNAGHHPTGAGPACLELHPVLSLAVIP